MKSGQVRYIKGILDFNCDAFIDKSGLFHSACKGHVVEFKNDKIKIRKVKVTSKQKEEIIKLNNLKTVDELLELKPKDFQKVKGIGKVKANDIFVLLQETKQSYNHLLCNSQEFFKEVVYYG